MNSVVQLFDIGSIAYITAANFILAQIKLNLIINLDSFSYSLKMSFQLSVNANQTTFIRKPFKPVIQNGSYISIELCSVITYSDNSDYCYIPIAF